MRRLALATSFRPMTRMRSAAAHLSLALATALAGACARQAQLDRPESPASRKTGILLPARLLRCALEDPYAGSAALPDASADFQVDPRGRVRDVRIHGSPGPHTKALRRHLESCEYAPATRDGRPVASGRAAVYGGYRP